MTFHHYLSLRCLRSPNAHLLDDISIYLHTKKVPSSLSNRLLSILWTQQLMWSYSIGNKKSKIWFDIVGWEYHKEVNCDIFIRCPQPSPRRGRGRGSGTGLAAALYPAGDRSEEIHCKVIENMKSFKSSSLEVHCLWFLLLLTFFWVLTLIS